MMANNEATLLIKIKQAGTEILDRLVITAGDVVSAFKTVADFVGEAIEAFREEEAAINKLTTSMVNAGVFTQDLKNEYINLASALQKVTTFGDEEIVNATAILQAYSKNQKVSDALVKSTLDLAAAKGMDLASAAELVGKTIGTETNALARQGIEISKTATEGERLAQVISGIDSKYKGQAETAAQGLGATKQLSNAWSDFMETIGRLSAPFISSLARMTTSVLNFFTALAGPNLDTAKLADVDKKIAGIAKQIMALERARVGGEAVAQLQKELDETIAFRDAIVQKERASAEQSLLIKQDKFAQEQAQRAAQTEAEVLQLAIDEQIKGDAELAAKQATYDKIIASNASYMERLNAIRAKEAMRKKVADKEELKSEEEKNKQTLKDRETFLSSVSTLQNSHNKAMAAAGKAAAIAQIWINTYQSAASSFRFGSEIGGPYVGAAFAALAIAAGASQAARVAGVQLAEGGIVMPTPGGTQATIGEGGQPEAVIPLDRAGEFGMGGGGVTINFNGPIMGDQSQAEQFARVLDRELLKLRQSNQSVAFETDVV